LGSSQPLRLVVDARIHGEEFRRFEANVVRWPGAHDCAIWAAAIGADGYGRNRAELHRMWHSTGVR
jgi:hypothetical protein